MCITFVMGFPLSRQHMRNCMLSGNQLFQDILSYNLPLIGCSESSSDDDVRVSTGLPELFKFVPKHMPSETL